MNSIVSNYERYARVKSQITHSQSRALWQNCASFGFPRRTHKHISKMQTLANNYDLGETIINFTKNFFFRRSVVSSLDNHILVNSIYSNKQSNFGRSIYCFYYFYCFSPLFFATFVRIQKIRIHIRIPIPTQ